MSDLIMVSAADMAVLNLLRSYAPLRRELERAIVVSSAAMPPDVATLDSRVRYMDETEGVTRTVSLVYLSQADAAKGKVSVLAPAPHAGKGAGPAGEARQQPATASPVRACAAGCPAPWRCASVRRVPAP